MAMEDELSLGARNQLDRFCRQYLQLQPDLTYPDEQHLADGAFQATLHKTLFADDAIQHPPPQRYRLRVLKELTESIEQSIHDWDKQVGKLSYFLTLAM